MKNKIPKLCTIILFFLTTNYSCGQAKVPIDEKLMINEVNEQNPFGKSNPKASPEIKDFDLLIGNCNCKSLQYANGKPLDTLQLKWRWKYILNGYGVQDDGWFGNDTIQSAFTSIRVLNPKTKKWHVPFFTPNMTADPSIWIGGKDGENIVLKRNQKTAQGEFESILTFSNISAKGFNWEGKIFIPSNNVTNTFWKIWCVKEE